MEIGAFIPRMSIDTSTAISTAGTERNIRSTTLPNGLRIFTERMEHVRSVCMGVWVCTGSRDEQPEQNGISHFVEHMLFKGTHTRNAQQLAREVDDIGGNIDAFTGKEMVGFNIKVLDTHTAQALEILSDLVMNPMFQPDDIAREQGVVTEEIKMDEDNPDYLVHELFVQNFWRGHALSRPILGTRSTVESFAQAGLFSYHDSRFHAGNMFITAAGNLQHDEFVAQLTAHFGTLAAGTAHKYEAAPAAVASIIQRNKKSLEQVQLCLGVPAPAVSSPQRHAGYLLSTILGGGMSSRLFQSVREEHGLAYSIYSELNPFRDTGSLCVYAGCSAAKAEQVVRLTISEMRRLKDEAVSQEELDRARNQLKGNLVLGMESSSARMGNLARQQMYFGRFYTMDELVAYIDAVTSEDVRQLATELFTTDQIAFTILGNLKNVKITRDHLTC
jgi:predicted Zn-dependent peptidase